MKDLILRALIVLCGIAAGLLAISLADAFETWWRSQQ